MILSGKLPLNRTLINVYVQAELPFICTMKVLREPSLKDEARMDPV
jgi:hypothetical protein